MSTFRKYSTNILYNRYEWGYIILFVFLFLQSVLANISEIFEISDEVFAVWGFLCLIFSLNGKQIWHNYPRVKQILHIAVWIAILGWISTFFSGIQPSIIVNLTDCFTFFKFFLIFYLSLWLLQRSNIYKIIIVTERITKYYIIIGLIFLPITQVINTGMGGADRFALKSFWFLNGNPGDYSSILILALVIFHIYSFATNKSITKLKVATIILIIFTFRGKAFGFVATYIFLILFINKYNKISTKTLLIIGIFTFAIGFFQIQYYFLTEATPRALFLAYGIKTANDYFPLGSGFSSFGSNMAKIHYSDLYYKYGFDQFWGMNPHEQYFLNDNFWPMIMAQYGWIGMIGFISILVLMFKIVNKQIKNNNLKIAGFSIFFLLVYSSIGGPIFVHYIGSASIIIFSLIITCNKRLIQRYNV